MTFQPNSILLVGPLIKNAKTSTLKNHLQWGLPLHCPSVKFILKDTLRNQIIQYFSDNTCLEKWDAVEVVWEVSVFCLLWKLFTTCLISCLYPPWNRFKVQYHLTYSKHTRVKGKNKLVSIQVGCETHPHALGRCWCCVCEHSGRSWSLVSNQPWMFFHKQAVKVFFCRRSKFESFWLGKCLSPYGNGWP